MEENKSSVPKQSEPEQITEAQEQQTAAEQESQSMEQVQNAPEQIDYKSELEKANLRIAELEKKSIMHNLLVKPDDYDEILPKAMKLVDEETSLEEAFSLLAAKYPEKIRLRPCIDMGGTTKGTDFGDDSFTSAFRGNLPNSYPSTANANTVKDRSGFFEKR
jgi:hypothetical protein